MKLSNEELQKIYFGAYRFEEIEDGYLQAFQYTQDQVAYFKKASDFWYDRCLASTSKTIELTTNATNISFDYRFLWKGSEDSIELSVDGLITQIFYIKDLKSEGTLNFDLTAALEGVYSEDTRGMKKITIYLPADATLAIKNFQLDGDYELVKKGPKVLWLGDSITQGFGPLRSSQTYVSVANSILNYDIINQGIGGYVYDKNCLLEMKGYKPEKLIVALGTNQYGTETMKDIEDYYPRLFQLYGKDIPTLVITPLWRGDNLEGVPTLVKFCDKLKEILKQYPNIKIVDGFKLVPHLPEYYIDNLHPNALGAEVYGRNLVQKIQELGF
ncbi:MAG: SGNH/GDSL hydrolase family protein [Treponema sp.]|nr:SGNH/GDSL hydrolase family protein [Treponema sp.]